MKLIHKRLLHYLLFSLPFQKILWCFTWNTNSFNNFVATHLNWTFLIAFWSVELTFVELIQSCRFCLPIMSFALKPTNHILDVDQYSFWQNSCFASAIILWRSLLCFSNNIKRLNKVPLLDLRSKSSFVHIWQVPVWW